MCCHHKRYYSTYVSLGNVENKFLREYADGIKFVKSRGTEKDMFQRQEAVVSKYRFRVGNIATLRETFWIILYDLTFHLFT